MKSNKFREESSNGSGSDGIPGTGAESRGTNWLLGVHLFLTYLSRSIRIYSLSREKNSKILSWKTT